MPPVRRRPALQHLTTATARCAGSTRTRALPHTGRLHSTTHTPNATTPSQARPLCKTKELLSALRCRLLCWPLGTTTLKQSAHRPALLPPLSSPYSCDGPACLKLLGSSSPRSACSPPRRSRTQTQRQPSSKLQQTVAKHPFACPFPLLAQGIFASVAVPTTTTTSFPNHTGAVAALTDCAPITLRQAI